MNPNSNVQTYEKALQTFKRKQNQLPQQIKWKLNYISGILQGKTIDELHNLPQQYLLQIQDLKDQNEKALKVIFVSIIRTLYNQDIAIDKSCLIRKAGFFKSWHDGFIKYDDTFIYLNCQNRTSRYRFKNFTIKANNSSQRAFDFYYKGNFTMTIKFQKPQSMQVMFKTIKQKILGQKGKFDQQLEKIPKNKKERESGNTKKRQQNLKMSRTKTSQLSIQNLSQSQKPRMRVMQFQKSIISQCQANLIIKRKSQPKHIKMKDFKLFPLADQNFTVRYSSKQVFIAVHKNQVKLNLEIILNLVDPSLKTHEILSCLAYYKNWNSKIIKQQLSYSMKLQQKAIFYRIYQKGTSLLSKQRQTYTMMQYKNVQQTEAILVQETLDNEDKKEQFIRAYIKSIFYLQILNNKAKLSIESQYDPKGFCSKSQAQDLIFAIFKDIIHFQNYLNEYSIKRQKGQGLALFEPVSKIEKVVDEQKQLQQEDLTNKQRYSKTHEDLNDNNSSQDSQKNSNNIELYRRSNKKDPFNSLKATNPLQIPTHQFLELVKKKQFQRYFFREHLQPFKILSDYDSYMPWYCLEEMFRTGGHYEITQNKQLRFINQKLIQSQKDILRFLIKQIGANIISGKSVLNVSLPVDIFEPRTLLERSASSMGKCPDYLSKVYQSDPLEQIMNVTAFIATVPTLELVMQKPFNPILGQTFQCYLKGIPLSYEQISHHPPISSYYMECQEFKLYGNLIAFADVGLNSGVGGNIGVMHIIFKNGYHYECHFPPSQISGLIYGDRKFRSYGKGFILERSQNLFAEFSIEKTKKGIYESKDKMKPGSIIGGIFKINSKFYQFLKPFNNNLKKFPGLSKQHIVQKLVHINGLWFDKIFMNDLDITSGIRAYPVQYYPYSLPSDANFRLDVLYHKQNNLPESQRQKELLQNIQRQDRKLREKYDKKNKK